MPIRFATPADSRAILDIYARYIDTTITFEYTLPALEEFTARIVAVTTFYPYLVYEEDGRILGYAYAHRFMERAAYQWGAEWSAYLAPAATGKGLGKKFYAVLAGILALQGVRTVYGIVTIPNEKSQALHQSLGFTQAGYYRNAGYKNGTWCDVAWFEKTIGDYAAAPAPVVPAHSLPADRIRAVLESL
ncbi:MAG: N-acetyltransferase family protein [Planctomycetes bacterium]|nr:N-acetyltransferase family protein [Planctomycetota bacterium]MCD7898189.1 N-acetyltransferase family protein [Planctomycetaceae bacterium]